MEVRGDTPRPVSPLWVIGTFLLIAAVAGSTFWLTKPRSEVLDMAATEAEFFASTTDPLPFRLALASAQKLPSAERVLSYRLREGETELPGEISSLTVMEFPAKRAKSVLEDQFQKLRFDSGSKGGGGGRGRGRGGRGGSRGGGGGGGDWGKDSKKPKLQDAGFLDWRGYSANFARLRHSTAKAPGDSSGAAESPRPDRQKGGDKGEASRDFYDTVRVNLSVGGRCVIAYIRFAEGAAGSKEAAAEALAAFRPLDS